MTSTMPGFVDESDVSSFADAVRAIVADSPGAPPWSPCEPCDDRDPRIARRLATAGWVELAGQAETLGFVAPAAYELGRALASPQTVDGLLGCPLALVDRSPGQVDRPISALGRYVAGGDTVVVCSPGGTRRGIAASAEPVGYTDSIAAARVQLEIDDALDAVPPARWRAWIAASVGYLAGLVAAACELTWDYADQRVAFGHPLSAIESVAIKIADVSMTAVGLELACGEPATLDTLRYAGSAAVVALGDCHQVAGAIGFTLEFPLQRLSRRAMAMATWNDQVADALAADAVALGSGGVSR